MEFKIPPNEVGIKSPNITIIEILQQVNAKFHHVPIQTQWRLVNKGSWGIPENDFKCAVEAYPFLETSRLRTELKTLYMRQDFHGPKGAVPLLQLFLQNDLQDTYSEVCNLLRILVTTPMSSAECERCFSTLKRIKTFLRSTMKEERLNALAMLSIEKEFVRSLQDFNKRVTETFAQKKDRRMDFLFKSYFSK